MSTLKDYGNRHPDWIHSETPLPIATHDARYGLKLAIAKEWLGRWDRGVAGSTHAYRNAAGKRTEK